MLVISKCYYESHSRSHKTHLTQPLISWLCQLRSVRLTETVYSHSSSGYVCFGSFWAAVAVKSAARLPSQS